MPLDFPSEWRFAPPVDGDFVNESIPTVAVSSFLDLIESVRTDRSRKETYEHFKRAFGNSARSTSEDWAQSDLHAALDRSSRNAPTFVENFYDACEDLRESAEKLWFIPNHNVINTVLAKHNVGYQIEPPELKAREVGGPLVTVAEVPPSFAERAKHIMNSSLCRSESLLDQGHPREAVHELLWLLETVSTAFKGVETATGRVEGKYFNKIVGDLKRKMPGTALTTILHWITQMHGYLSAPGGGGVRHGTDLDRGVSLDANHARLFCNLTRSYISYLIVEFDSLSRTPD